MLFRRKSNYDGAGESQEDFSNRGYVYSSDTQKDTLYSEIPMLSKEEVLKGTRMTEDEQTMQSRLFALIESGENPEEASRLAQELGESWGI